MSPLTKKIKVLKLFLEKKKKKHNTNNINIFRYKKF